MISKEIIIHNKIEMQQLAIKIASLTSKIDVITLQGDLGAGKTFFAQNFIKHLISSVKAVVSPTFLLLQNYVHADININHYDLYRLKDSQELIELGLEDNLESAINLIEWPEIAKELLSLDRLELLITREDIQEDDNEEKRKVILQGYGSWEQKLHD